MAGRSVKGMDGEGEGRDECNHGHGHGHEDWVRMVAIMVGTYGETVGAVGAEEQHCCWGGGSSCRRLEWKE